MAILTTGLANATAASAFLSTPSFPLYVTSVETLASSLLPPLPPTTPSPPLPPPPPERPITVNTERQAANPTKGLSTTLISIIITASIVVSLALLLLCIWSRRYARLQIRKRDKLSSIVKSFQDHHHQAYPGLELRTANRDVVDAAETKVDHFQVHGCFSASASSESMQMSPRQDESSTRDESARDTIEGETHV